LSFSSITVVRQRLLTIQLPHGPIWLPVTTWHSRHITINYDLRLTKFKVKILLGSTVSWPVCIDVKDASEGQRPDFQYYQRVKDLLMWVVLSDERTGLYFTTAAGPRQRSDSPIRVVPHDGPKPGGPPPHIYIPQEQGTQIQPQTLGPFLTPAMTLWAVMEVLELTLELTEQETPLPTFWRV
jgi:hypothetical protein